MADQHSTGGRGGRGGRERRPRRGESEDGFDQKTIELTRVTRVMAGGKRMRFRACVVVGDKHGRVGSGVAKGGDVNLALTKAATQARKHLIAVPLTGDGTIPHEVQVKFKAAKVLLKPAAAGTGVIAGGAVRYVLLLAGVANVLSKILGSSNKINNVQATILALQSLKQPRQRSRPVARVAA